VQSVTLKNKNGWTLIDPEKAIHPLRNTLSDKDWERINLAVEQENYDNISMDEMDAWIDHCYDVLAAKIQTVPGTTVLQ
jgi:hypothetical protein